MDTVSGLLFEYNIYFENAHLENILKIINIFLLVDLPLACMTYFRWKGKGEGGLHGSLDTVSGLLFDYNIYFENALLENILKIINIFLEKARSRPSSRLYDIFQVEKGKRGTGTTVVWIQSQAYYSTITFILKMHIWKLFKK